MALYFRTRQFEKLLVTKFSNKLHKTVSDLDRYIEQDLTSILTQRDRSSCPAFENYNLRGGGCKARSTFKNQELNLIELCSFKDSSPVYSKVSLNGKRLVDRKAVKKLFIENKNHAHFNI